MGRTKLSSENLIRWFPVSEVGLFISE